MYMFADKHPDQQTVSLDTDYALTEHHSQARDDSERADVR